MGTGTSHGVPMIGCKCSICTSNDQRNQRTRTSALIRVGGSSLLIDTAPELRLQCLTNNVEQVNAVLFTHSHADHIFGLDDIRRFNEIHMRSIPCFGSRDTLSVIRKAFEYVFVPTQIGGGKPMLDLIEVNGVFEAAGVTVVPIPALHGALPVLGYRISGLAYLTDCSFMPESSFQLMEDLDLLVLGVLRHEPHETHFSLEEGLAVADRIGARRTRFVHISHSLDHERTNRILPDGVELAYDGLRMQFRYP